MQNSALRNEKLTQLVAQLKSEVCDLKCHAKTSDADHTKIVADLKDKYCELLREKHRDKKSVNNVSVCHQFILNCLKKQRLTLSYCFQILSVKLKELESLRSHLHEKEKPVILSTLNTTKVTASMIHAERTFASAKMQGMLKQHKEAMEREHNVDKTTVTLKDSQLAKKDGEINMLKARVTQVQTKHKAKLVKQADIINCKQDSIEEQTSIH